MELLFKSIQNYESETVMSLEAKQPSQAKQQAQAAQHNQVHFRRVRWCHFEVTTALSKR